MCEKCTRRLGGVEEDEKVVGAMRFGARGAHGGGRE